MRLLLLTVLLTCAGLCHSQAQIEILRLGNSVPDGGTDTISSTGDSPFNINYTIRNDGTADLTLTGMPLVEITTTTNCTVVLLISPPATVTAGDTETFTLQVSPVSTAPFSFGVSIEHDVAGSPYTWTFSGNPAAPAGSTGGRKSSGCSTTEHPSWLWLALLGLVAHRLFTPRDKRRCAD